MHNKLPKEIDPFRLAQNGLKLRGQLLIKDLPRLTQSLQSSEGVIDVIMAFDVDEIGTPYMKGQFTTSVAVICERCMKTMTLDLNVQCSLAMVIGERKIMGLSDQYEPWIIENNDPVLLSTVVEDELILSLPIVPKHDNACLPGHVWSMGETQEKNDDKPASPFSVLSVLKTNK